MEATKLEKFKGMLLEEKKKLEENLSKFATPTDNPENYKTRFNQMGEDREENASEVEEYADNIGVEDNLEKQLHELNDALERIENGTYGVCDNCGEEISEDRLMAYPAAKTCIKCNNQ